MNAGCFMACWGAFLQYCHDFMINLDVWSTVYWTELVIIYRCKEKMKVVFDLEKGGKAVAYVYYTIYFDCWNTSFERRDGESKL